MSPFTQHLGAQLALSTTPEHSRLIVMSGLKHVAAVFDREMLNQYLEMYRYLKRMYSRIRTHSRIVPLLLSATAHTRTHLTIRYYQAAGALPAAGLAESPTATAHPQPSATATAQPQPSATPIEHPQPGDSPAAHPPPSDSPIEPDDDYSTDLLRELIDTIDDTHVTGPPHAASASATACPPDSVANGASDAHNVSIDHADAEGRERAATFCTASALDCSSTYSLTELTSAVDTAARLPSDTSLPRSETGLGSETSLASASSLPYSTASQPHSASSVPDSVPNSASASSHNPNALPVVPSPVPDSTEDFLAFEQDWGDKSMLDDIVDDISS